MTDFEIYSLLIGSIGIVISIIIIVIALWGERIRQIWNSPKLKIFLTEPTTNITVQGVNGWYYLIRVSNERKSAPAKNVRILLLKVFKKRPDGEWYEKNFSGPTQVSWQWPRISPLYATIGPDEQATFGALLEDSKEIQLKFYNYPNNLDSVILAKDPTRLEFQAVSDTAESNKLLIEISWNGKWHSGKIEMENNCVIKTNST